ncbi:MAG: hypothetical protein WCJ13_01900 [Coriobacteriia bacterium]
MVRQRSVFDIVGVVMSESLPSPIGFGHGTNPALVAGLLGTRPDDLRIRHAFELSDEAGLSLRCRCRASADARATAA